MQKTEKVGLLSLVAIPLFLALLSACGLWGDGGGETQDLRETGVHSRTPSGSELKTVEPRGEATLATPSLVQSTIAATPTPAQPTHLALSALPAFPTASVELRYRAEDGFLYTPDGRPAFRLDSARLEWLPFIPAELASGLGSIILLRGSQGEWLLTGTRGPAFLVWDAGVLDWVELSESRQAADATPAGCEGALPSRLAVGMQARVLSELNLRSSPGFDDNLIWIFPVGTTLEVIGGPACKTYGEGAIVWWEVRDQGDRTGWCAEGSFSGRFYFLEPAP